MYGHPDEMSIERQIAQEQRGAEFDRLLALQARRKPTKPMSRARMIQVFREEWENVKKEMRR